MTIGMKTDFDRQCSCRNSQSRSLRTKKNHLFESSLFGVPNPIGELPIVTIHLLHSWHMLLPRSDIYWAINQTYILKRRLYWASMSFLVNVPSYGLNSQGDMHHIYEGYEKTFFILCRTTCLGLCHHLEFHYIQNEKQNDFWVKILLLFD